MVQLSPGRPSRISLAMNGGIGTFSLIVMVRK
ncbi:unnamed protein product [Clonostachys rosea f. rosea IK726]|uniref:Uncharacterized protein n=1 Tax=Clonostachys rosea f. rosea IK726 TaxID=1349383 RepID=A0ACA9TEM2_BIOOC|nr:unnamed protein product [Clonostachys rosea f. rosea IK726]